MTSMKRKDVEAIQLDELDIRDELDSRTPSEELESIQLYEEPEHTVYVGSKLPRELRDLLVQFLRRNMGVFAWKQKDMQGIDLSIISHKLNVNPACKSIKQK